MRPGTTDCVCASGGRGVCVWGGSAAQVEVGEEVAARGHGERVVRVELAEQLALVQHLERGVCVCGGLSRSGRGRRRGRRARPR
ncbi:unnamed protein product [Colias eurytheme]|nr:unnamed protein product [Colias eurytheme]